MKNKRKIELEGSRKHFPLFAKAVNKQLVFSPFHLKYYRILHYFAIGKIKKLIVTVPPQHGKSLGSTTLLPSFILGRNPDCKIAIASYSNTFAKKFNKSIQRIVDSPIYYELFTETKLGGKTGKYVRDANEFEIVDKQGSLRAIGRGGSLTGLPVDVMIMDDLYKDAMEGNSPTIRDSVWNWYTSTVKTRLHNTSQELIVFTRWHEDDLIGRLTEKEPHKILTSFDDIEPDYKGWYVLNFEAIKESEPTEIDQRSLNTPLWPERHSLELLNEKKALDPHQFSCMYQGSPTSKEGLLYGDNFMTYSELPETTKNANYTDTADLGDDMLCSICYRVGKDKKIYVTDVIYTSEGMEYTEDAVAKMLKENDTRISHVESNNGGRGFARNVSKLVPNVSVKWFHQSGNKESRILTNSATVLHNILMPKGWEKRWPKFYSDVVNFKRLFRANKHDDAPDTLTGIVEKEISKSGENFRLSIF